MFILNRIGHTLLQEKQIGQAIAVFQENHRRHPKSWNAHDSLADAYLQAGKTRVHFIRA